MRTKKSSPIILLEASPGSSFRRENRRYLGMCQCTILECAMVYLGMCQALSWNVPWSILECASVFIKLSWNVPVYYLGMCQ